MTDMKKCIALIDDMFKGISFDITKPIEMNQHSRHYSPYKFVDGGYLPYDSKYWSQQGKETSTMDNYNSYYRNDNYLKKYNVNKSEVIEALDCLAKGGAGSGRTKSAFKQNYLDDVAHSFKMKDIVARKEKEKTEKDKKKKDDKAKPAKEKHNADVRRLVSYLKSEDSMENNDEKLLKSLGFTSEPVNLINEIKEDESISKAIQEGNIQPHGRHDLNWHERPNQVILKAYGSENLKDNHGEKVHKDNDKKMEKEVSKIEEIEMPEEEKAPKSRKLADAFTGKSEVHDALNSLMKAEEVEETDGEEEVVEDEAQAEAIKELKDSRVKGTEAGAEEESMKSSGLSDLAKACGDYMEAAMGKDYAKMDKKGKKKKVDEEMKESKKEEKEETEA